MIICSLIDEVLQIISTDIGDPGPSITCYRIDFLSGWYCLAITRASLRRLFWKVRPEILLRVPAVSSRWVSSPGGASVFTTISPGPCPPQTGGGTVARTAASRFVSCRLPSGTLWSILEIFYRMLASDFRLPRALQWWCAASPGDTPVRLSSPLLNVE